jgi:2'-5' RNA ligase
MQGEDIEIANARSESYGGAGGKGYKPSEVVPSTIEEDVVRRELTYNTLMIRLMDLASGPDKADIVDLTGCGLRDLEQGVMQCPADPNKVFSDDPSRMVRVIKFALRYGHKLTPDTLAAIRRNADKLKNVPSGHLSQMLASLVLKESTWKPALEMMADLGLLDPVREMLLEDKSFRAAVQNHVNNGRMDMMFGLMDVGLPLGTRVQFLSGPELTRLREITLGMDRDEAWEYLGSVKNPGNAYKDKRFIPGLAQQYGFQGKGMARFMPVVISVGRQLLLADPALAHDPNRLKRLVEQGVGDEMKRTKLAEATGKTTGYRESVGLFIPLPELLADQFPPPGGNDTSPSHVTLFYGGMVPEDREEEYLDVLRRTLAGVGPVKARIGDLDYFTHVEKNRRVAYVRVWFSKDMGSLRDRIRSAISDAGFEAKDSFPLAYNPHITLQYMDDLTEEYSGPVPEGTWQFDSIPVWGLPKEHSIPLRGGSAVRVACAHLGEPGLLPVMSPVFNLREIAKQLLLLEDHLFHPGKRCPDCVKKHTLMAEALAEEAVTLDPSGQLDLTGLADDVRAIGQSIASEPLEVAAQNIRQLRKALVAFIGAAALVGVDG